MQRGGSCFCMQYDGDVTKLGLLGTTQYTGLSRYDSRFAFYIYCNLRLPFRLTSVCVSISAFFPPFTQRCTAASSLTNQRRRSPTTGCGSRSASSSPSPTATTCVRPSSCTSSRAFSSSVWSATWPSSG